MMSALRSPTFWSVLLEYAAAAARTRCARTPRTRRQWLYIATTAALMAWLIAADGIRVAQTLREKSTVGASKYLVGTPLTARGLTRF